jgi:ABC-type oligopeptide transport system substrate-binding subunit
MTAPRGEHIRCAGGLVAVLAVMPALGACRNEPVTTGVADSLVVVRPTDAASLDPARASDIESLEVAEQVYGRLVRFARGRL